MRALALDFERRSLAEREVPEPVIETGTQVLLRIREVGVCGTDRELAEFQFGFPPAGSDYLVIGHEAIGEVQEAGSDVRDLRPGDWVVPMVRRNCRPPCPSCVRGRRDLCTSGTLQERGIFGFHGYFCETAVDDVEDLVPVPASLADKAVLIEPLSVVEKAVEMALRLHQGEPRRALVLGAGPIGILAATILRLRALEVKVHSLEPATHPRAKLIESQGIEYLTSVAPAEPTSYWRQPVHPRRRCLVSNCSIRLGYASSWAEETPPERFRSNRWCSGTDGCRKR